MRGQQGLVDTLTSLNNSSRLAVLSCSSDRRKLGRHSSVANYPKGFVDEIRCQDEHGFAGVCPGLRGLSADIAKTG